MAGLEQTEIRPKSITSDSYQTKADNSDRTITYGLELVGYLI